MKITLPPVMCLTPVVILAISLCGCKRGEKKDRALESAVKYFEANDYPASEIELKNSLKAGSANYQAFKLLGIIRGSQGADYEAARILMQVKTKLPKDDEVGVRLAQSLFALGYMEDGRKELFEVLDRSPANADALILLVESSLTPEWEDQCDPRVKAAGDKTPGVQLAAAMLEIRRGSLETGEAMLDSILKADPRLTKAHVAKAAIFTMRERPDEALAEMKLAAECAPPRSRESINYARALLARGRRDEAVACLENLTVATPDFLTAWAMLGQIASHEKKDELASKHFSLVLSKNPVDQMVAMMQAEILVRGKQPQQAVELLEKVASALPSRPPLDFALAKCYLAADKPAKAAVAVDRVIAAAPGFTEAARLRAGIYLQEGKTADALSILEAIRKKKPDDAASRDLLIHAYRAADRNDDAIALLREKSAGDAQNPQSQVEIARILMTQEKRAEARSVLESTVRTFADNLPAVSSLAAIELQEDQGDAALKRLDDYLTAHPDSTEAHMLRAGIALDLKKPGIAEQSLHRALELKPDHAGAFGILLRMKSGAGQDAEALALLDRYLKNFPADPQAGMERGRLLEKFGRHEDARAAYLTIIAAAPDFAPVYNNLASLESGRLQDLENAAKHARKARTLAPEQPAIADTLGWIEWRLGNYPAALSLLLEAAAKMADSPEVLHHLGMAHYSMGQSAEADAALAKALAAGADFPEKADSEKYLAILRQGAADLETLKKRVAGDPKDVMSRLQLADLLARQERHQEALEAYQQAFAANPAIPAALVGQARLYSGPLKSPAKALELATRARELAPRDPKVLAALGSAKLMTGNHDEAYGLLKDAAVSLDGDSAVAADYARAAYSLGRIPEARTAMARVTGSAPAAAFLLLTDPASLKREGIASEVAKALAENPADVPALMLRGQLEAAAGKSPEATYLEVLKIHPRFSPARVKLAAFYLEDPEKLEKAMTLALEARPSLSDDPELTRILAFGNYRRGDFRYAAQLLGELSIKRPLQPGELLVLGLSLANSKQPGKARQSLEEALKGGLAEADAAQAKNALTALEKVQ